MRVPVKELVAGWTVAVVLLWVVLAAVVAEDCSPDYDTLCFEFDGILRLFALPALGLWLVGLCVIWIVRRVRR